MRRKIDQLINGIFEYDKKPLHVSRERIEEEGSADTLFGGSFTVQSPTDRKVRGFLYSSNPRVAFDPPSFYGAEVHVQYQVDTNGMAPGETTAGQFTICSDRGELALPYRFRIREEKAEKESDVRDAAQLGRNKAIIQVGHFNWEEPGMKYLAEKIQRQNPELAVHFVPSGDAYQFV